MTTNDQLRAEPVAPSQSLGPRNARSTMAQTDQGTLAGRYLRQFWQPVLLSEQLLPGRALPVQLMGQSLTVYRGQQGAVHAVGFRCAHRNAQLSVGTVEGDQLRCLYHGWKYDSTGACVERPAECDAGRAGSINVGSYPTDETLGLIFVYLGDGAPPAHLRFPEFEDPGVREAYTYERACNYFLNIENGVDEAHLPFTHAGSVFDVLNYAVPEIAARETEYGLVQTGTRADGRVFEAHFMMPNILTFCYPASDDPAVKGWTLYLSWRVPLDDIRHMTFIVEHFKVDEADIQPFKARRQARALRMASLMPREEARRSIFAGRAQLKDFADRPDYLLLGDDVVQCAQGATYDKSAEKLGRSDVAILLLRRLWTRELQALSAGTATQAWKYPSRIPRSTRNV